MCARSEKRFGWIAVLLLLVIVCAEQGAAQSPSKTGRASGASISPSAETEARSEARKVHVYKLSHADASAVAHVISAVMAPGPRVAPTGEHELIVAGTDEQFVALEEVLKQLDQPPAARSRLTRITLKHRNLGDPEKALLRAALPEGTRIAVDSPTRTILVRGSDADVSAVLSLVDVIDKPVDEQSEVLELTFFFLKSPSTGPAERRSQPVPAFLEPVVQALAKNGFRNPSLMTPLMIRTQEGDTFSTSGALTEAVVEPDRAAQGKLAQVVPEVNFTKVTLENAIDHIRSVGHLNIVVRWPELGYTGIDRDTEVSIQLKDVALGKALEYVLDSASTQVGINVGYLLDDGVVVISTREGLREKYGSRQTPLQVSVEGKARVLGSGKSAQLDVEAEVYLPPSGGSPMSGGAVETRQSLFRVETALALPLGEYVVLAAGPVAPDVGQGIAMVVRAEVVGSTGGQAAAGGFALPPGVR